MNAAQIVALIVVIPAGIWIVFQMWLAWYERNGHR